MKLDVLFENKHQLYTYRNNVFQTLHVPIDIPNPFVFIPEVEKLKHVGYFELSEFSDQSYDIYVVTSESIILMYVISVKATMFRLFDNGLAIRTRQKWDESKDELEVKARYTFEDFLVITNKFKTATIFCKNLTSDPKT